MAETPETRAWMEDTEEPRKYLGELERRLDERKISKAEFARRCGCSSSNISRMFRVDYYVPKYVWRTAKDWGLMP